MANATATKTNQNNQASLIRQLIGVKRITDKYDLVYLCERIVYGIEYRLYDTETIAYPADLYNAAYGVVHGFKTGRVDGYRGQVIGKLSGKSAVSFVLSLADKKFAGDDVSRYINGQRFVLKDDRLVADYN